jgi:hypothetical protein
VNTVTGYGLDDRSWICSLGGKISFQRYFQTLSDTQLPVQGTPDTEPDAEGVRVYRVSPISV